MGRYSRHHRPGFYNSPSSYGTVSAPEAYEHNLFMRRVVIAPNPTADAAARWR